MLALGMSLLASVAVAQPLKPIRGVLQGTVTVDPISLPDLLFKVVYHAQGRVQGMGIVTTDIVTPEVEFQLAPQQLVAHTPSWNVTLVGRNGDSMRGVYTFPSPVIPISTLGFFTVSADVEITGGTGRFAGAQGTAKAHAVGNALLGRFAMTFEGTWSNRP
jgi:hypothetical protein